MYLQVQSSPCDDQYPMKVLRINNELNLKVDAFQYIVVHVSIQITIFVFVVRFRLCISHLLQSWQRNQRPERSAWEADFTRGKCLHM